MSLVNRQIDPLIYIIIAVVVVIATVMFLSITTMEERNEFFKKQKEIILNSTCDELKQLIINHYEGKIELIGQNILTAKNLHEWKCEK